eukprot:PhF_6_TR11720/c0_g1_i2/m.19115/K14536/RIA1; ribosome assembly protein 1
MESGQTFLRPPQLIRNFCMLAHVDHGKTTLSDFLISNNGVLAPSLAGKVRYLDMREDEQRKFITVKTSTIALEYKEALLNLVDSPGHVDFSVEVSVALRVCDGALVIVDVVDGFTTQTEFMLRNAYYEGVKVCLVLNKIDLLFTTVQLTAAEAEARLRTVIENCNVVMSTLKREREMTMDDDASNTPAVPTTTQEALEDDMLDNNDEGEEMWFSPSKGNVAFTSGLLGFGFVLEDFVERYHAKFSWSRTSLRVGLWGDYYFDGKRKRIAKMKSSSGSDGQQRDSLFVKMVLQPLWDVFTAATSVPRDVEKLKKIATTLDIASRFKDDSVYTMPNVNDTLQMVLGRWIPLDVCLMRLVYEKLPSPVAAQKYRVFPWIPNFSDWGDENDEPLKRSLQTCDPEGPTTVYVAKLIEVPGSTTNYDPTVDPTGASQLHFFCFTRVLSGVLRKGDTLYIHNHKGESVPVVAKQIALFRGYGILDVESVSAGALCAIGANVADQVIKCATLCQRPVFPDLRRISLLTASVLRTAVRPKQLSDLPTLIRGLQVLNRVDIQVDVIVQETGDYVMCTAGEVHAERCLTDLKSITHCDLEVSPPVVPFRETIMQRGSMNKPRTVTFSTPSKNVTVTAYALRLPETIRLFLDRRTGPTTSTVSAEVKKSILEVVNTECHRSWQQMFATRQWWIGSTQSKFTNVLFGSNSFPSSLASSTNTAQQQLLVDAIVAGFGLGMDGGPLCEEPLTGVAIVITEVVLSSASTESSEGAPAPQPAVSTTDGTFGGQVISIVRTACRQAVSQHVVRLVEPMYDCDIFGSGDCQGRIYAIISQCRGDVLGEFPYEGSNRFVIRAMLPVAESIGIAEQLHIKTSGKATCLLRFCSVWNVVEPTVASAVDQDGEQVLDDNDNPIDPNAPSVTKTLVERIKRMKGLASDIVIPKAAEKQKFSSRCT